MADFFRLENQQTEDKVISREQRIYADTLLTANGTTFGVNTTSNAPTLKLKFYLDVIRYYDDTTSPISDRYYRVGKYIELEPTQVYQHFFSQGWVWFTYSCTANDGNGTFEWKLECNDQRYTAYISSVVLEDSFYNPTDGWLNPDNPNNLISVMQVEELNQGEGAKAMSQAYALVQYRNVSAAAYPYVNFYTAYEDDFLQIGWYKIAAASTQLFIIPKGIHSIKMNDATPPVVEIGTAYHNQELMLAQSTVAIAVPPAVSLNHAVNLKTKYPLGNGIPENVGAFDITTVIGAIKTVLTWEAVDGYTYSVEIRGNILAIAANAGADLTFLYLGRNLTGQTPVVNQ